VCSVANCTPLLIQQNDGSGGFNRPWAEYKVGFGQPSGNYWLGNDLLSQLTANYRYKLRFDLQQNSTGNWYYAEYSWFRVLSEAHDYTLLVTGYSGNVRSDVFGSENGAKFSTIESGNRCAAELEGGFWYRSYRSYQSCSSCGVNAARSTGNFYWSGLPRRSNWRDRPANEARYLQLSRMWLKCKQ